MVGVELPEVDRGDPPSSADDLADRLIRLVEFALGPNRTMTAARLAMFVEAGHDDGLREQLIGGRVIFEARGRGWLAALGAPDPVHGMQLISVCVQGIFLQVIGGYVTVDVRRLIRTAVAAAMRGDG